MQFANELIVRKITDNEAYVVSEKDTVAAGESHALQLRNPSDSTVYLWLWGVNFTGKTEYTYTIYDDFDSITDGTQSNIQNANLDNELDTPSPFEAYHDPTFTEAADAEQVGGVVGAGGGGPNSAGGSGAIPPMRLEPGRQIVLEQTNDNSDAADMTILCFFTE